MTDPKPHTRKWRKRFLKFGVAILLLPILVFAGIQTPWGKGKLSSYLSENMRAQGIESMEIGTITGFVPFALRIEGLSISDTQGKWIEVEELSWGISAFELLFGELRISAIDAKVVRLHALPQIESSAPVEKGPLTLPEIPKWLTVEALSVGRLELNESILGQDVAMTLSGKLAHANSDGGGAIALTVRDLDEPGVGLALDLQLDGGALTVQAKLNDDTYLPDALELEDAVAVVLNGSGPLEAWGGDLQLSIGADSIGAFTLDYRAGNAARLQSRAPVNLDNGFVPDYAANLFGSTTNVVGLIDLSQLPIVVSGNLSASSDVSTFEFSASVNNDQRFIDVEANFEHRQPSNLSEYIEATNTDPLRVAVQLEGPMDRVNVRIQSTSARDGFLEGDLNIGTESPYGVDGSIRFSALDGLWAESVQAFTGDDIDATIDLSYDEVAGLVLVESLDLNAAWMRVQGAGSSDWERKSLDGAFTASIDNLDRFNAIFDTTLQGSAMLTARLEGSADTSKAEAQIVLSDVAFEEFSTSAIQINLSAEGGDWRDLFGTPTLLRLRGFSEAVQLRDQLQPRINFESEATLPNGEQLIVHAFSLDDLNTRIAGAGTVQFDPVAAQMEATVHSQRLSHIASLFDVSVDGDLNATVQLASGDDEGSWIASINSTVDELDGLPDGVAELVGNRVALNARADLAGELITVHSVDAVAEHARVNATGSYALDTSVGTADANIAVPDLSVLSRDDDDQFAGSVSANVHVDAIDEQFDASLTSMIVQLSANDIRMDRAEIIADLNGASSGGGGTIRVTGEQTDGSFDLTSTLNYDSDGISFPVIAFRNKENIARGDAAFDFADSSLRLTLNAEFPDLRELGRMVNIDLSGSTDLDVAMTRIDEVISTRGELKTRGLMISSIEAESIDASWDITDLLNAADGDFNAKVAALNAGTVEVNDLDVAATLKEGLAAIDLKATGQLATDSPWSLDAASRLSVQDRFAEIQVLQGELDSYRFVLESPTRVSFADEELVLNKSRISLGDGYLEADGSWSEADVALLATWKDVPMSVAALFGVPIAQGTSDGDLRLTGSPESPEGTLNASVREVRMENMILRDDLPSITANAKASLGNNVLEVTGAVSATEANTATVAFVVPAAISLASFEPDSVVIDDLTGRAEIDLDLAFVPPLLDWGRIRFGGRAKGQFDLRSASEEQRISGTATIRDGLVDHPSLGGIAQAITIDVVAEGTDIRVVSATATDGAEGTLAAQGNLTLDADAGYPFRFEGELAGMALTYQDSVTSSLSGSIGFTNVEEEMELFGNLRVGPSTVILRPNHSSQIVELAVLEVNGDIAEPEIVVPGAPSPKGIRMNIDVEVPGRAFVLATDLRTEWAGKVKVGGTTQDLTLQGEMRPVQGFIAVLGRRFALDDSESSIIFDDDTSPPTPYLNVVARASRDRITARLSLRGPLDRLEMELTSEPLLPTDEILSQLLFGRSVTQITPVQALQLARAVALFSGSVDGLPFLSGPSRMKGIDTFDVKMQDDAPVLGVGKYLSDGVFVEIEQGSGVETSKVRVDIDLLPTLKLQTSVGGDAQGGLGLFWKRDY